MFDWLGKKIFKSMMMSSLGAWSKAWLRDVKFNLGDVSVTTPYKQSYMIYSCVNTIADSISGVPFTFWEGENQIYDHPIIKFLNRPNQQTYSFAQLIKETLIWLNIRGEAFWVLLPSIGTTFGISSIPAKLYLMDPGMMKEELTDDRSEIKEWKLQGKDKALDMTSVVQFKLFDPYITPSIRGLSPIESIRLAVDSDYKAEKYNDLFFTNGAAPGAIVSVKSGGPAVDEADLVKIQKKLDKKMKGMERAHNWAVFPDDLTVQTIGLSHKDMMFIQQRNFSIKEITSAYRIPRGLIDTEDIPYANLVAAKQFLWSQKLIPQINDFLSILNNFFFPIYAPGITGKFDLDKVPELQETMSQKLDYATKLFDKGVSFKALNERFKFGIDTDTMPGADISYIPTNYEAVGSDENNQEDQNAASIRDKLLEQPKMKLLENKMSDILEGIVVGDEEAKQERTEVKEAKFISSYRNKFVKRADVIENEYASKLKKFLFKQRAEVLSKIEGTSNKASESKSTDFDKTLKVVFDEADQKLVATVEPTAKKAVRTGAELAFDTLGIAIDFNIESNIAQSIIDRRMNLVKGINRTTFESIKKQISAGVEQGETLADISERVRSVYRFSESRSLRIAQTETAALMSESSQLIYKENGVEEKMWIASHDERTRESHLANELQGPISINENFKNGCAFPGDPDGGPEESINCRCALAPVVGEKEE